MKFELCFCLNGVYIMFIRFLEDVSKINILKYVLNPHIFKKNLSKPCLKMTLCLKLVSIMFKKV